MGADDTSRDALIERVECAAAEALVASNSRYPGVEAAAMAPAVVDAVIMPLVQERDQLAAELDVDLAHQRMDAEGRDCPVCTHMAHEGAYDELDAAIKRAEAAEAERDLLEAERDQALAELDDREATK